MFELETVEMDDRTAVVRLSGKLLLGTPHQLVEEEASKLVSQGKRLLIFDLSKLTQIDSTGIGRFISSYNQAMQVGAGIVMAGAEGTVRQVFRVTRLDTIFKFFPTVDEARSAPAS